MGYEKRVEFAGAIHHVTTRGNNFQLIVLDEIDRLVLLEIFAMVVVRHGWIVLAYCEMGNHYHLLVLTPEPNLARGMQVLNGRYARRFNARHGRSNHLFGRRYRDELVERDAHLLEAVRYIVLNPVRAGLCERAGDWPWSSYLGTAGFAAPAEFLAVDEVLGLFDPRIDFARDTFIAFVEDGLLAARQKRRAA